LGDLSLIQILEPALYKQKGSRVSKTVQLIISEAIINIYMCVCMYVEGVTLVLPSQSHISQTLRRILAIE
jgi:hypothetical protein